MTVSAAPALSRLLRTGGVDSKSALRQLFELALLRVRCGHGPGYYYCAGLNRRDADRRELFGHFSHMEYADFVSRMNPPPVRRPLDSKSQQKKICAAKSIATPEMLMHGKGQAGDVTDSDRKRLAANVGEHVVVKPDIASGGGHGIEFLAIADNSALGTHLVDGDGRTYDLAALNLHMGGAWLMERAVRNQHPWYAALSPRAINSWRVWVIQRDDTAEPEIMLAYLRMARGETRVDNQGAGGLLMPLLPDGTLGRLTNGHPGDAGYDVHPDSGHGWEGGVPPEIGAVFAFAGKALKAFEGVTFAGLDIAVTTDGPLLIEANFGPDRIGAAWCRVPMKCWLADRGYIS